MRLSTSHIYNSGMSGMLNSFGKLNKVVNQMGTGKRMLSPSDDPVAAAQTLNTKIRLAVVAQYNRNVDFADKNLSLTESVLDQTETDLMKMKDLAIQLGSGQWSDDQIKSSGLEAKEVLSKLQGLLNTKNESGEYIFAGSQANKKAYEGNIFQGDAIEREAQVADDTFIKMLTSGARAFEDLKGLTTHDTDKAYFTGQVDKNGNDVVPGPDAKEYPNNMLGVLQYFADSTGNGVDAAGNPSTVDQKAIQDSMTNIDIAFEQVAQTRSQIGARQNTLASVKENNKDFEDFAEKSLSELEDLDWGEAIMRLQTSMMSYQAGMQVTGKIQGLSLFNYI